jgi:hypothetical protein
MPLQRGTRFRGEAVWSLGRSADGRFLPVVAFCTRRAAPRLAWQQRRTGDPGARRRKLNGALKEEPCRSAAVSISKNAAASTDAAAEKGHAAVAFMCFVGCLLGCF